MWRRSLLCSALTALGCTGPIGWIPPDCTGGILEPADLVPRQLLLRVLLTHRGVEQRHQVAIDASPGRVVGVGLTPIGTVAYRLRHDAEGLEIENRVGGFLGLDAKRAYDAIVRGLLVVPAPAEEGFAREVPGDHEVRVVREVCRYEASLRVVSDSLDPSGPTPLSDPPDPSASEPAPPTP